MKFFKNKTIIIGIFVVGIVIFAFGINQILLLRKAHSTFADYYAFRGCTELVQRGEDFGLCKVENGQTIKIVKFQEKWYLDGDLPCGFICL